MNETTRQGITAFQAGDRATARQLFISAARQFPNDADAWLWLSAVVEHDSERMDCLRRVLRIDPNHPSALKGMQLLQDRAAKEAQPAPEAAPELEESEAPNPFHDEAARPTVMEETPAYAPRAAGYAPRPVVDDGEPGERIFATRPSLAPLLILTWVMILLVWVLQAVIPEDTAARLTLSLLNCGVLAVLILYAAVKLSAMRYELTTRMLVTRIQNRRVPVPLRHIFHVSKEQNWMQKLLRIADLRVEGVVGGVLTTFRLRNVPDFEKRYLEIEGQRQG